MSAIAWLTAGLSRTTPPLKSVAIAPGASKSSPDVSGSKIVRQVAGEHIDPTLESSIRGAVRVDESYDPGRDIDDLPAVLDERK